MERRDQLNKLYGLGVDLIAKAERRSGHLYAPSFLVTAKAGGPARISTTSSTMGDAEELREFIAARRVVNGTDKATKIGGRSLVIAYGTNLA